MQSIQVRDALPVDLESCLQLDGSFDTGRVWQLDLREGRGHYAIQLRAVDLPRQLRVDYPTPRDALFMHWQRGYCLLVAEHIDTGRVLGYIDVGPEPDLQLGWVWHLVVDRHHRRQRTGSLLLNAAVQWSREHGLRRLTMPLQSQNDPGICFCQRRGLTFYGFNDSYFSNGSVALFFGRNLR